MCSFSFGPAYSCGQAAPAGFAITATSANRSGEPAAVTAAAAALPGLSLVLDDGVRDGRPKLPRLEYLNVYGTKVSDEGMKALAGIETLRSLYVWQTGVTAEGIAALKRSLPRVAVDSGDAPSASP